MRVLLVSYDNSSFIHYFPLGIAYVASKLIREGIDVEIYPQDVYHYPESHLIDYLKCNHFDVVGVGMCGGYYQYAKAKKIAEAVNGLADLWFGGHLVSPDPDYFSKKLGATIFQGEYDYNDNVDEIPHPSWHLFNMDYYSLIRLPHSENGERCFPVLSGRGCPFRCNFCYRLEKGYRSRSIQGISDEVGILIKDYHISYIDFADELLMNSEDRTVEISQMLKPLGIKWMCNGRLNYAKPIVLREMKDSGCVFVNYGIEAFDDTVLKNMNKSLTKKQIIDGVEATLEAGLTPGLNIIWGNIGDTVKTLWAGAEFLKKYNEWGVQLRTIRPVTPYPGSELFKCAVENGLIKDTGDFYENLHKNSDLASVQFTGLSNDEFHHCLSIANGELIDRYLLEKHWDYNTQRYQLYEKNDTSFRGFRQT